MVFGLQSALITYTIWEMLTIVKTSESQLDQTIQLIRHLLIGWRRTKKALIFIWTLVFGRKTGLVQGYLQAFRADSLPQSPFFEMALEHDVMIKIKYLNKIIICY